MKTNKPFDLIRPKSPEVYQNKKGIAVIAIILITAVVSLALAGGGVYYWQNQEFQKQKQGSEKQVQDLEKQLEELKKEKEELEKQGEESQNESENETGTNITPDYSSGENVIKTYYKALNAKDWDTAYSCFSKELQNQQSLSSMKASWQNIKSIKIKSMTQKYVAASARIYEAMVEEDAEYINPSLVAGGDTHFINTTDTTYQGDWRITQIATSPINI